MVSWNANANANPNPARDKPLLLQVLPVVVSTAALAMLVVSLSSFWCDAKKATIGAISGHEKGKDATTARTLHDDDNNLAIYHELGVKPPHNSTKVVEPGFGIKLPLARWSWMLHGRFLPLLHFFERGRPDDVFVNLRVLWCKLLISLDSTSLAYEGRNVVPPTRRSTGNHKNKNVCASGADDNQLYATYRMLPPYSIKWALRYLGLWRIFPRWMHANIELRIVYLQTALEKVFESKQHRQQQNNPTDNHGNTLSLPDTTHTLGDRIQDLDDRSDQLGSDAADRDGSEYFCVIVLGGGYDPRGAKLSASSSKHSNVQRVYELDLPEVVDSKRRILLRAGFDVVDDCGDASCKDDNDCNQGNNGRKHGVRLEGVDLNDDAGVDRVLDKIRDELVAMSASPSYNILQDVDTSTTSVATKDSFPPDGKIQWRVVLISEALLLYLDPGKAERILEGVSERFRGKNCKDYNYDCSFNGAIFVFADRLMRNNRIKTNGAPPPQPPPTTTATTRRRMTLPTSPDEIEKEKSEVEEWLRDRGWELNEVLLKPGATRHLGIATTVSAD